MKNIFRRKANRLMIHFDGYGLVPLATYMDDWPIFYTALPEKIGDDAIIYVEGGKRKVRLLNSSDNLNDCLFLVDMGEV